MAGHSKWANIKHRKGRQDAAPDVRAPRGAADVSDTRARPLANWE